MTTVNFGANNTTRYLSFPGIPALTGDFCVSWLQRYNPDAAPHVLLAAGAFGEPNSMLIMPQRQGTLSEGALNAAVALFDSTGASQVEYVNRYIGNTLPANADVLNVIQRHGTKLEGYAPSKGASTVAKVLNADTTLGTIAPAGTAYLGRPVDTAQAYLDAPIGRFFILVGTCLTDAEVLQLANGTHVTALRSGTLVPYLYWLLEGASGTEEDQTVNNHDGTRVGTGWTTTTDFFTSSGGSTPTVADVDTDESITATQTAVVATVTNAGATQSGSTLELVQGSVAVAQTVNSWSATSISFNTVLGALRYTDTGITTNLRLTVGGVQATLPITLTPPTGFGKMTLSGTQNTGAGSITANGNFSGTLGADTQIEFVTTNGFNVLADGSASASAAGTYACRANLNDGTGWQAFTVTLSGSSPDTTAPNIVGSITVGSITQTTASLAATFDESGNYGIAIIPAAASNPAVANVLAGNVSGALWSRSTTAESANVAISASLTGLTAGQSYKPVLAVQDSTGNSRLIVGSNFTMQAASGGDTTPPTISITVANNAPTHTFTASPSDNVGVVGVQWYLNGSPIGIELLSAPWTLNWSESGQPAGTYAFTARARDAAGLTTLSNSVQVIVAPTSSGGPEAPAATGGVGNYEPRNAAWVRVQEGR